MLLRKSWQNFVAFGLMWAIATVATLHWFDPDLGWHLASGQYFLTHGIPSHDVFSYTHPTFHWIDHEWLNDVIMWLIYKSGGYIALAMVMALVWSSAIWLGALNRRTVVIALGIGVMLPYLTSRPTAWTALLLAVTLRLMTAGRWRWLPPLFMVWANLHGGFIIGLVTVALFCAWRPERRKYFVWLAAAIIATLINPYGYDLYVEIWRSISDPSIHKYVVEWQPINLSVFNGIWLIVIILCLMARVKIAEGSRLALTAILLAGSVLTARNLPLLVIAGLPVLETGWQQFLTAADAIWRRGRPAAQAVAWLGVVGLLAWHLWAIRHFHANGLNPTLEPAVAALKSSPCQGRLFNDYDYGGYLEWRLPGQPVYIDGRMPSWPDGRQTAITTYAALLKDPGKHVSEFDRYHITCALFLNVKDFQPLRTDLQSRGWKVTFEQRGIVLIREDKR